jgi:hypothetical protein
VSITSIRHNIWKRQRAFALAFVSLSFIGSCNADTGCAYDPRTDGTWTRYQLYQIGGHWDPKTRQITVAWRYPKNQQTFVWKTVPNTLGTAVGNNENFFDQAKQPSMLNVIGGGHNQPGFVLYDAVQSVNGKWFIGEIGSQIYGETVTPGEPKIPMWPEGGEHYEIDHWVQDTRSGYLQQFQFHTSFYAITGPGYTWARADGALFHDCVWTSLEERPNDPVSDVVYNYVFQKGVGIVNIRWGNLRDHVNNVIDICDGQYTAYEYQAIAFGHLPLPPTP